MKPKTVLILLCALTSLAVLAALALHASNQALAAKPTTKTFEVHGQIRAIDLAAMTIRISHQEIPHYMPAMTMPFVVKDATLLKGLTTGDSVQFQLAVTDNDSWIAHIEKIADDSPNQSPTAASSSLSLEDREAERVQLGEVVPDFKLVDQDGRPVHLSDFRGKAVVLTFIYTRCPLPNFCPLMSRNFADLEKRLRKEFGDTFRLLSISMDSEFDTPAVLKEYAARYDANLNDWTFATGDAGQIETVARLMGLYYVRENGLISHDLRTALIGPDGRLIHIWKSNVWTPYEVQRLVRETLSHTKDIARR